MLIKALLSKYAPHSHTCIYTPYLTLLSPSLPTSHFITDDEAYLFLKDSRLSSDRAMAPLCCALLIALSRHTWGGRSCDDGRSAHCSLPYLFRAVKEEHKFDIAHIVHLSLPTIQIVLVPRKPINQKLLGCAPLHGLPQETDGDLYRNNLPILDVVFDEVTIFRAAVPLLTQEISSREMDKAKLL